MKEVVLTQAEEAQKKPDRAIYDAKYKKRRLKKIAELVTKEAAYKDLRFTRIIDCGFIIQEDRSFDSMKHSFASWYRLISISSSPGECHQSSSSNCQ